MSYQTTARYLLEQWIESVSEWVPVRCANSLDVIDAHAAIHAVDYPGEKFRVVNNDLYSPTREPGADDG